MTEHITTKQRSMLNTAFLLEVVFIFPIAEFGSDFSEEKVTAVDYQVVGEPARKYRKAAGVNFLYEVDVAIATKVCTCNALHCISMDLDASQVEQEENIDFQRGSCFLCFLRAT